MQQVGLFTETFQQIQSRKGPKEAMNIISKSVFYISIGSNDFNHFLLQNASGAHSRYWPWEFNRLLVTSIRNELKVLFICFTSKVFPYLTGENCGKLEGKKKTCRRLPRASMRPESGPDLGLFWKPGHASGFDGPDQTWSNVYGPKTLMSGMRAYGLKLDGLLLGSFVHYMFSIYIYIYGALYACGSK